MLFKYLILAVLFSIANAKVSPECQGYNTCSNENPPNCTIHLAHETYCNWFIKCHGSTAVAMCCNDDLVFNAEEQVCGYHGDNTISGTCTEIRECLIIPAEIIMPKPPSTSSSLTPTTLVPFPTTESPVNVVVSSTKSFTLQTPNLPASTASSYTLYAEATISNIVMIIITVVLFT